MYSIYFKSSKENTDNGFIFHGFDKTLKQLLNKNLGFGYKHAKIETLETKCGVFGSQSMFFKHSLNLHKNSDFNIIRNLCVDSDNFIIREGLDKLQKMSNMFMKNDHDLISLIIIELNSNECVNFIFMNIRLNKHSRMFFFEDNTFDINITGYNLPISTNLSNKLQLCKNL